MSGIKRLIVDVELAGQGGLEPIRVQVNNHALVGWDLTYKQKGWPKAEDANLLWLTWVTWKQMQKDGTYAQGDNFAAFREDDCLNIDRVNQDADVDPTPEAAPSGSASLSRPVPGSTPDGSTGPTTQS